MNKAQIRYQELKDKYSISYSNKFDVEVRYAGSTDHFNCYKIVRNAPKLSAYDLAVICSKGDLFYGFEMEGTLLYIDRNPNERRHS